MVTHLSTRLDVVFRALGDPARLRILTILAGGPLAVTPLAEAFEISRPAISRHLRVLEEAGLVTHTPQGRQNLYRLEETPLQQAEAALRALWQDRLHTLKHLVEKADE